MEALPSRSVLDRELDGCYNVWLVAGDHRQQDGLNCGDTYAPMWSSDERTILDAATHEGLKLWQFDICTTQLNRQLEQVHILVPAGLEHVKGGGWRVLRF